MTFSIQALDRIAVIVAGASLLVGLPLAAVMVISQSI
jgi:hypothetical protein